MPIRLADIYRESKSVTFEYEGESVTVEYRHKRLTPVNRVALMGGSEFFMDRKPPKPAQAAKPQKPAKGKKGEEGEDPGPTWREVRDGNDKFFALLADILVGWDVLGEDGQPLPATAQWLEQMPQDFLTEIIRAMFNDSSPNPTRVADSPAT